MIGTANDASAGQWGGIVLLGKAPTNKCDAAALAACKIEAEGNAGPYGGDRPTDSSGILKFVQVKYAGYEVIKDNELNGVTFAGVGSGTVVDYLQVHNNSDDGVEFFGGTVSPKNLYAFATADDDYDFDFGYTGTVSNSIARRDPQFVDNGDAGNGVECDNDGVGSIAQPFTHPKLIGLVLVGPNVADALTNHNLALRFRRATQFTVTNSTFFGYMKGGFSLESNETATFYKDGTSKFENNSVGSFIPSLNFISKSSVITSDDVKVKALAQGNKEISITIPEIAMPAWINGWTRFPAKGQ